jgi:catechol 2,3-dioxygenase-like lactoylglutathione lyase family enzyme
MSTDPSVIGQVDGITLDCPDPKQLATFYQRATGWPIVYDTDEFVYLGGPGTFQLGFQRVAEQQPPEWPSPSRQGHLAFSVSVLDDGEKRLLELGATKADVQPNEALWRVLIDPAGHPFYVYVR